jgi:hypothetical protein
MSLVLFGVGLLVTAAGFVTIGFGIPINAFSLGNTLIIAGTTGVVGGLLLIGLAAAVRQLKRVGDALGSRAGDALSGRAMARPAAVAEDAPLLRVPPTAGRTPPPKPVETAMPRPPEPHVPVTTTAAATRTATTTTEAAGPLDWLRPISTPSGEPPVAAEPAVMEVPDEAPLSPRAPQRPVFTPPSPLPPPVTSSPAEPKAWAPGRAEGAPEPMPRMDTKPPALAPRSEQVARMTPPAERPKEPGKETGRPAGKDAGLFDVVWPDARAKPMAAEPARREPEPMPSAPPREDRRAESSSERPVAILKSGVIDGMAYTLYADGSIEAELPQGTVRFASVDALRAHLEKSS